MAERENKWHENDFASQFCGRGSTPISTQIVYHSALHYLGNLKNKTLLDIACAEGHFTRLVKDKGASRVVGVDISGILLENAQKIGGKVEYRLGNAFDLDVIDQFDFVTANRLIQFAESLAELKSLCRGFYQNLKYGGRFVGVTFNCFEEPTWDAHFGKHTPLPPINEAKRAEVVMHDVFRYVFYYYDADVYENAFKEAGFRSFSFQPIVIDKSVEQPDGYWDLIEERPHLICIVADK